MLIAGYRVTEG